MGVVGARGIIGCVVVLWDNMVLELVRMEVGMFPILCWFRSCKDEFVWVFTWVYGPTRGREGGFLG